MAETSTKSQKRKAEDPLAAEAPNPKKQLCACHNGAKTGEHAIALAMNNHDLIQLGISQDEEGNTWIKREIVEGILSIIRARPKYWHFVWRYVETRMQQLLDAAIKEDKDVSLSGISGLLSSSQEMTEVDHSRLEGYCATTLGMSQENGWNSMAKDMVSLELVLRYLVGLEDLPVDETDRQVLAVTVLDLAKLSDFALKVGVYESIDPETSDKDFWHCEKTFRALRGQMARVVLYYDNHWEYISLMAGITKALNHGRQSKDKPVADPPSGTEGDLINRLRRRVRQ